MKCPKCGHENKPDAKFCSSCGYNLKEKIITNFNDNSNNKDKNNNTALIIVAATVIIVIAIALITAYSVGAFGSNDNQQDVANNNAQSNGVQSVSLSAFPVSEAPNLAAKIGSTGDASNVNFKGVTLSKAQVLYVLTKSISLIGSGQKDASINVGSYSYAPHPSGGHSPCTISSAQYVDMCNRFSSWIERNHQVPNYVGINSPGVPDVSPSQMINMCDNILIQYKNTGSLPGSIYF